MSPTYKPPPPEMLKELEANRRYVETSLKEGSAAALAFEDHEELDLAGVILSGATLQETNFSRCRLDDARLNGALANGLRLEGASLARASFVKAQMVEADFSDASGPWTDFTKVEMHNARFDRGDFVGARFFKIRCMEGSFQNARLDEADFTRALLDNADFTGASLDAVDFAQASVEGANFTGAFFTRTTRLQGCRYLEHVIADRIYFDGRLVEGAAAREALKSLTSPTLYDLLSPRECRLRLMLDAIKAARRSELTLKAASDSLSSLCSALEEADPNWKADIASHIATLGSAGLAGKDGWLNELDPGHARVAMATLDTLDALVRAQR